MYYNKRKAEPRNHHSLPNRSVFLVFFLVAEERRGLVAELVDEDLELQHSALFGAAVLVFHEGFEEKRVGIDGPVERMGLEMREKEKKDEDSRDVGSHLLGDESVLRIVVLDIDAEALNQDLLMSHTPFFLRGLPGRSPLACCASSNARAFPRSAAWIPTEYCLRPLRPASQTPAFPTTVSPFPRLYHVRRGGLHALVAMALREHDQLRGIEGLELGSPSFRAGDFAFQSRIFESIIENKEKNSPSRGGRRDWPSPSRRSRDRTVLPR